MERGRWIRLEGELMEIMRVAALRDSCTTNNISRGSALRKM